MKVLTRTATIIGTTKKVGVYRSSRRDVWIDCADCKTEYKPSELDFDKQ